MKEVARQTKAVGLSLEQNAYNTLLGARTDSVGVFLASDPQVITWHLANRGYVFSSDEEARRMLFALLRINAHQSNYLSHAAGQVGEDLWVSWRNGAVADFAVPEYRKLWPIAKRFYAASFVAHIDDLLAAMPQS